MRPARRSFVLLCVALALSAGGQLAAKGGANAASGGSLLNPLLGLTLLFLAGRALVWAAVLRRERLVFAYPFMALSYPLVLFLSSAIYGEALTIARVAGSLLVVAGVSLISVAEGRT